MLNKIIKVAGIMAIIGLSCLAVLGYQLYDDHKSIDDNDWTKSIKMVPHYVEDQFYDLRMRMTLPTEINEDRIVLATIDDNTLSKLEQWPLLRTTWAKIVDKFTVFGAKVLAFDVVFSEPARTCPGENPDRELADAFRNFQSAGDGNTVIVSFGLTKDPDEGAKDLPDALYNFMVKSNQVSDANFISQMISAPSFPIPEFVEAEIAMAYIQGNEDLDGVFRTYPIVQNTDPIISPSLSLLAYQKYTGDAPEVFIDANGEGILKLRNGQMSLNHSAEVKLRYSGGQTAFKSISLYDVITAKDDDPEIKNLLKGKLVFIGSTAFGAHDLRHTPVDPKMPGVFFHINMVKMMLDGKYFQSEEKSLFWSWGILLLGTLIIILISFFKNPVLDVTIVLLICLGMFFIDTYYLLPQGYQITLFFSLFSVFGTYLWNTMINFYLANKDKKFLKSAFGSYISPELIDVMYKSGEPPKLGGVCDVITAYFTDIQGFSSFSEKLSAPKLVELLNEYLTAMTDILLEKQGTLDKYEGDAIIAFFGAPVKFPDHASRALKVALEMQAKLGELRKKWVSEGDKWPSIVHEMRMRIGVNSGEIVTGNMGSRSRMNYTMMGDSVNLAARLESSAKQYGVFTHISHFTRKLVGDEFVLRELDTIKVVGKSEPVTTFEVLAEAGKAEENLLQLKKFFEEGLKLYKEQKWDEALAKFEKSLECEFIRFPELKHKDNPSKIYIERCTEFKKSPPPQNWDGVYTLKSK